MDKTLWQKAVAFHGHECPGLAIGCAVVSCFFDHFGQTISRDEEIVCITENDTCAVDAVQALLGCTFGKGNLICKPHYKMVFSFYLRKSGDSIRLYFDDSKIPSDLGRDERKNFILDSNPADLFKITPTEYQLPEYARVMGSIKCDICHENVRQDKLTEIDGKKLCLACLEKQGMN